MSDTISPEMRLAGDIAAQFRHRPADEAAAAIATHIRQFWDPRMRRHLLAELAAGVAVDPLLAAAAARLREE
ncbi:formate dehydrogenase subunit delta [Pseudonocardia sp. CA-107938]|uniref:formate dehydrogenase subunit delta n=1 Tax=Pseudonocardia sp. CA-107938 TaxID=3240021 RepID=UPI003D8FCA80